MRATNCAIARYKDAEAASHIANRFRHLWTPTVLIHCSDNGTRTRNLPRYLVGALTELTLCHQSLSWKGGTRTPDLVVNSHPFYRTELQSNK